MEPTTGPITALDRALLTSPMSSDKLWSKDVSQYYTGDVSTLAGRRKCLKALLSHWEGELRISPFASWYRVDGPLDPAVVEEQLRHASKTAMSSVKRKCISRVCDSVSTGVGLAVLARPHMPPRRQHVYWCVCSNVG